MNATKRAATSIILFIVVSSIYLLNSSFSYLHGGVLLSILELSFYGVAIHKCIKLIKTGKSHKCLLHFFIFFILCFLGDLVWHSYYYAKFLTGISDYISTVVNFTFAGAFLVGSYAFRSLIIGEHGKSYYWDMVPISISILGVVLFSSYVSPSSIIEGSLEQVSQHIYIGSNLLITTYLISVFIFSRNNSWVFISAGLFIMFAVGFEIVVRETSGLRLDFDLYEFIYAYGLILASYTLFQAEKLEKFELFTFKSLQVQIKLALLILSMVTVLLSIVNSSDNIDRFVYLGVVASTGLVLSAIFSQYIFEKVASFNKVLSGIFFDELSGKNISGVSLPFIELRDVYENSVKNRLNTINQEIRSSQELIEANKIKEITSKVAHDIRSPLAALEVAFEEQESSNENVTRVIKLALERIHEIANNLLDYKRASLKNSCEEIGYITNLIQEAIAEKKFEIKNKEIKISFTITKDNAFLFSKVVQGEFRSILSNIFNNSIESFDEAFGSIVVSLESLDRDRMQMRISDNGSGIPQSVLAELGVKQVSYGKENGNGLGLFNAKAIVDSWGGELSIHSSHLTGTDVVMKLLKSGTPNHFEQNIKVEDMIVILDDDPSITESFIHILTGLGVVEEKIKFFSKPSNFLEWYSVNRELNFLLLCDQDLNDSMINGFKIIESLSLQDRSYLVTGQYSDSELLRDCSKLGLKVIPKPFFGFIDINR